MNLYASNRKQLALLLFLGLVLVPALGTMPVLLAPDRKPNNAGANATDRFIFPAVFVLAGAAIVGYALRYCPDRFTFADTLTVHYLFRKRVIRPEEIVATSSEDRSVTLGGDDSIPMTARDFIVSLQLADGSRTSWALSKTAASEFTSAFLHWQQRDRS